MTVCDDSVSVPGKALVLGAQAHGLRGQKQHRQVGRQMCGRVAATTPSTRSVSTLSGRCGPCCSVAATGSTAMARASVELREIARAQVGPEAGGEGHGVYLRASSDGMPGLALGAPTSAAPGHGLTLRRQHIPQRSRPGTRTTGQVVGQQASARTACRRRAARSVVR